MDIYNYNKGFELLKNRINIKDLEKIEYDREVILAGWIVNIKNMGNVSFIILRDQTEDVQITIKKTYLMI
jgi:Aspartyl/asparaginyl-tRNA synthetases